MANFTNKSAMTFLNEIVSIPRQSGNEMSIRDYLVDFAKSRELSYYSDEHNNVIIYKNNSEKPSIALQTNIDFLGLKSVKSKVDFFVPDTIRLVKKGDYIQGRDSSFGCESLLSIALILELLDSDLPISVEGIFTSQKYNNMFGVRIIEPKNILSKQIIGFKSADKAYIFNSSCASINGLIKFNKEKIFLKSDPKLKTFKLSVNNLPHDNYKNIYVDMVSSLLRKIPHLYINKIILNYDRDHTLKNEVTFTTLTNEKDLKRIIKFFYIEQKKVYKMLSIKCSRQINNSLVLSNASILMFLDEFKQGVLRNYNGELLSQKFLTVDSDTGLINFKILADNEKEAKKQYEVISENCKKNNYTCALTSDCLDFRSFSDSHLLETLNKFCNIPETRKIDKLIDDSELGVFQDKIKKLDGAILSLPILDEGSVNERFSFSGLSNLSLALKNFFTNI